VRRLLIAAGACIAVATGYVLAYLFLPLGGDLPRAFVIAQGASLKGVARQLTAAGLVREPWTFLVAARARGAESALKAGNYEIPAGATALDVLDLFVRGRARQEEFRIIEGWTFAQVRRALARHPALRHDTEGRSDAELLALLGSSDTHAEGLFFPDTYFFSHGASDLGVLRRAYVAMQKQLDAAWSRRNQSIPVRNPYEALVLASIIEKETGRAEERAQIGGVLANRLRIGMRLQVDPTVIYGLGEDFDGNLRKRDLLADTPYNTYTRHGLPPTPIALPGAASLEAATRPAETRALYYVSRGDGTSKFSNSLSEHNEAVNRYQRYPKERPPQ
jgi:UPF0755 protein